MKPFDTAALAIILVETAGDRQLTPRIMDNIRTSLFSQEPTFVVVSGEGVNSDLTVALNNGIQAAISLGCQYICWAHPDMRFDQPNWHLPLIEVLDKKSSVLKICASNSRDPVGPLRLDQEQCWIMRAKDFEKYPNLLFDTDFKRIGGFEDWYQSYVIIASGYLTLVTPESRVFHAGMQTRKLRDTVQEQRDNGGVYCKKTGMHENPHQWKFFGKTLSAKGRASAFSRVCKQFPEFSGFGSLLG